MVPFFFSALYRNLALPRDEAQGNILLAKKFSQSS
jgi:hypothetical protein